MDEYEDEIEIAGRSTDNTEWDIEIEDDTPEEDRGREAMPQHIVQDLENDELDNYDAKTKEKIKQLRKVWHDERREKESAQREHQETLRLAQGLLNENRRVNGVITSGEREYAESVKTTAQLELDVAKRAVKDAYESGDSQGLVNAQERMNFANMKLVQAHNLQLGTLQTPENAVQHAQHRISQPQVQQANPPSQKAIAWVERNSTWFQKDEEMTGAALGLNSKLLAEGYDAESDEFYNILDKTIRKRFSERFTRAKNSSVVAPSMRSSGAKKIKLSTTQMSLVKKLGITPQQYANELAKLGEI